MKQLPYIFILIILLGLSACQREHTYPLAMQQAESLMNTRPDSALYLLQNMADTVSMLPDEAQMYYHLLTIQARDKQYITHTGDSLINRIVDFYEGYGDKDRLMMAYFYLGSTYRDMNDAPRALKAFQQAVDANVPNPDLLAKTYNQMGTLFMYQGLHDEVILVNRKAIELYILQGKRNKISYFLRDIARMYDAKNMADSALYYYKEACHTASADGDSTRYYGILGELGIFYYNTGEFETAKKTLLISDEKTKISDKTHIWLYLGHIYKNSKQTDIAKQYYQKTLQGNDVYKQISAHYGLSKIAAKEQNPLVETKHLRDIFLLKDSIDKLKQTEAIAKINSLYNYQHTENENNKLKLEQRNLIDLLGISFFCLLLSISFIIFYSKQKGLIIRNKKMKIELLEKGKNLLGESSSIEENNIKLLELNKQLQELKSEDGLQKKLLEIEKDKLKLGNQRITITNNEKETRLDILTQSEIFLYFHEKLIENEQPTEEHWKQLQLMIDQTYPQFTNNIKMLYPQISSLECQVCWLTKIGIAPTNIGKLINRTPSGVSNIKSRLYKKIYGTKGTSKNFSDFIANL